MFQAIPVDKDLYALLGVKSGASMMEIRAAYRRVALKAHPDKGGSAGDFHAISQAFDILSCYSRRRCFDRARDLQTPFVNAAQTHIEKVAKVTRSKRHFNTTVSKAGLAEGEPRNKRMRTALCNLHGALQSMHAEYRQASIAKMSSRVQKSLLRFMEQAGKQIEAPERLGKKRHRAQVKRRMMPQLCPIKSTYGRTYIAQMDVGFVRIWTRGQRDIEQAIEHKVMLSQLCDMIAVMDASHGQTWSDTGKLNRIVATCLRNSNLSADKLGLSACVQMRATEYVHRKYVATSPAMSLSKALSLRASLVSARRSCWERFRDQWIKLMCAAKGARSKGFTHKDAEAMLNKARSDYLEKSLALAVKSVEKLLDSAECQTLKGSRTLAREKRLLMTRFVKAHRKDAEKDEWNFRIKLLLQRELSADELLRFTSA